ncbi:MAG: hypothetical protein AAB447_01740 [Patescibacteria group bacterium]
MSIEVRVTPEIRDPRLPSNQHIRDNLLVTHGETLVTHLTDSEAQALFKYVTERGLAKDMAGTMRIDTYQGHPAFYIGNTPDCHRALFEAFGIEG